MKVLIFQMLPIFNSLPTLFYYQYKTNIIMKDIFLELTESLKAIIVQFISEVILLYKSFRG
ncbi:hypothetical protein GCM10007383_20140 [Arenibacter certesii]|uniref:Uncharacterized protein n=1 Tax=Arenibacter certesii TaxID=228955 RepID=A0A918IYX3_9FLAO|nr:hypothetical protein GCM10007383_20140 [Arenibacter certesii]